MSEPSLVALLECIHGRLDGLRVAPLTEEELAHLVAIDEWLADLTEGDADA